MARPRTYSDGQLVRAVERSRSWRGVLRELGLSSASSGALRSVRSRADKLSIDYGHFRPRRGWTDDQLCQAIATSSRWIDVGEALGVPNVDGLVTVRGHADRLGIETTHLVADADGNHSCGLQPSLGNLRRAGSMLAAAWYALCGCEVSWPLEPCRYDLLVRVGDEFRRVQVKTTTTRVGRTWKVYLSTTRGERRTYDPQEIDDFFIVDGELRCFLIPIAAVGGLHAIHLSAYDEYRVYTAADLVAE